jgi:hypothetical protein
VLSDLGSAQHRPCRAGRLKRLAAFVFALSKKP